MRSSRRPSETMHALAAALQHDDRRARRAWHQSTIAASDRSRRTAFARRRGSAGTSRTCAAVARITARARGSDHSFRRRFGSYETRAPARCRRFDGGEHGVAGAAADRLADARHMQQARAADHVDGQRRRLHSRCRRAGAQIGELVAGRAVRHEIDAGRRARIRRHAASVDAFVGPQAQERAAERVVADARDVPRARAEARRGDRHVRRVAAEAAHVGVGRRRRASALNSTIASPMATMAADVAARRSSLRTRRGGSAVAAAREMPRHRRPRPSARARPSRRADRDWIPCRSRSRPPPNTAPCCRAGCRRPGTPAFPAAAPRATPSSADGGNWSDGNILRPSAPAASAANASVGVATPGTQTLPCRFAARITAVSPCGITMSWPPAARDLVRPPRPRSPCPRRRDIARRTSRRARAIESNGRGELSGTSRMRKPLATSAAPTAGISSGVMPRSTAMSGSGSR